MLVAAVFVAIAVLVIVTAFVAIATPVSVMALVAVAALVAAAMDGAEEVIHLSKASGNL